MNDLRSYAVRSRLLYMLSCMLVCIQASAKQLPDRVVADSLLHKAGKFAEAAEIYHLLAKQWEQQRQPDSAFQVYLLAVKALSQDRAYERAYQLCNELLQKKWKAHGAVYLGEVFAEKGYIELQWLQLEASIHSFQQALAIEKNKAQADTLKLADIQQFLGMAFLYADQPEAAEKVLLQSFERYQALLPEDDLKLAYVSNTLYLFYYERFELQEAIQYLQNSLRIFQKQLPPSHPHISISLNNLSNLRLHVGDPLAARDLLLEVIRRQEEGAEHRSLVDSYFNLAFLYTNIGELEMATTYFSKCLDLADSLLPDPDFERANLYDGLGNLAYRQQHFAKADSFFRMGLQQKQALDQALPVEIARSQHNLALIALEEKRWKAAQVLLHKSLTTRMQQLGPVHVLTLESQYRLGKALWGLDRKEEALTIWKNCLQAFWETEGPAHPHVADLGFWIASSYADMHQADSVDHYLKLTWTSLLDLKDTITNWESLEGHSIELISPQVFDICLFHLRFILNQAQRRPAEKLSLSKSIVRSFSDFLPQMLPLLNSQQAQTDLAKRLQAIYSTAALIMHRETEGNTLAHASFLLECLENSNAFSIRLLLQHQSAMNFAGVPDSLISKDQALRTRIWHIRSQKEQEEEAVQSALLQEEATVIAKWQQLQSLFATQYPVYSELQYQKPTLNLNNISQDLLQAQQTFLAYFYLDSALLALVYDGREISTKELSPPVYWQDSLRKYNQLLMERGTPKQLARLGYFLYQELVAPIADKLKEKVILFPDGPLFSLNFELLLYEKSDPATSLSEMPWLIRRHAFQFTNRLDLYPSLAQRAGENIGMAPGFSPQLKRSYQNLLPSGQEADSTYLEWISTPWSVELMKQLNQDDWGTTLVEGEATKKQFISMADGAKIIHLATHAKANHRRPLQSFLAFHPSPYDRETGYLYAYELYGLSLKTSLVVLSACETGVGTYQQGEGVRSLAHAFQYAGSPSLIMSLWSIDDQQTNVLIRDFYHRLDQGKHIADAFRLSKLAYLDQHSGELAHPYYWGSMVFWGQDQVITSNNSTKNTILYLIGFLTLTIFSIIFLKKIWKKKQSG